MKFSGYSPKARQMDEKRSIAQRFGLLRAHAVRRGEEWNIALEDYASWSKDSTVFARSQIEPLRVCRINEELPWDISNLQAVSGRKGLKVNDDTLTLTVAQWVKALKEEKSDASV